MILPRRLSLIAGRKLPKVAVALPFECFMAASGVLASVPVLLNLVIPSMITTVLPVPASILWCITILVGAASMILALRAHDPRMISASQWLLSLSSLAYLIMVATVLPEVGWLVVAVGLPVVTIGIIRATYWGALGRLLK